MNTELLNKYTEEDLKALDISTLKEIYWEIERLSCIKDLYYDHPYDWIYWFWKFRYFLDSNTWKILLLNEPNIGIERFIIPKIQFFTELWQLLGNYLKNIKTKNHNKIKIFEDIPTLNLKNYTIESELDNEPYIFLSNWTTIAFTFTKDQIKEIYWWMGWEKIHITDYDNINFLKESCNTIVQQYTDHFLDETTDKNLLLLYILHFKQWNIPIDTIKTQTEKKNIQKKKIEWYIYLLENQWFHKIWKTINVQGRISSLATANPYPIKLIHYYKTKDYTTEEERLHKKFKNKRHNLEWFQLDWNDIDYIKGLI